MASIFLFIQSQSIRRSYRIKCAVGLLELGILHFPVTGAVIVPALGRGGCSVSYTRPRLLFGGFVDSAQDADQCHGDKNQKQTAEDQTVQQDLQLKQQRSRSKLKVIQQNGL